MANIYLEMLISESDGSQMGFQHARIVVFRAAEDAAISAENNMRTCPNGMSKEELIAANIEQLDLRFINNSLGA
ncbi:MAG: hypothetical protein C4K60_19745 [Ideonella sp. MAG2]|nr:MAG: hypothetical protein C4K60_19745 [Ideonella sp. MAG2]